MAIAACDLAGRSSARSSPRLKLLFGIPLLWGCLVTAFDTFPAALAPAGSGGCRKIEAVILALAVVATIGQRCFLSLLQIVLARPDFGGIVAGLQPSLPPGSLVVAIGILGATVMPHNLYLHSALVQSRRIGDDEASKAQACRFNLIDTAVALNVAFFVNAAILVLSAAVFFRHGEEVASIETAHKLLPTFLGPLAPILFGVALLCAGQSSTLTGTLAGQIIMEGYLDLKIAPWLRRLVTRTIALAPAVLTITLVGEDKMQHLLVLSQVVLSLQLAFAVVPLIHFTSNRKNMGAFATPPWAQGLAWLTASIIVGLNAKYVVDKIHEAIAWASDSGLSMGPVGLGPVVAVGLYGLAGGMAALLGWIVVKPWVRPSRPWSAPPSVALDWADALRPHALTTIGVALEHDPNDAEILNRALSLARPGQTRLVLLHVVDTPMTRVYGDDTADRETAGDERYLAGIVRVLEAKGFATRSVLLYGPDRAGQLVRRLRRDPVDLLVVGSHGHGLVRDLLFGQTVDKVRHGLTIPMLIARPDRGVKPVEVPEPTA